MHTREVKFSLAPRTRKPIPMGLVVRPLCKTAYYLCVLARREVLSISDLFIIEKIGFSVRVFYENEK
jgi:hypothetical protein